MIEPNNYSLSFTTSSARISESLKLVHLYLDLSDWDAVRQRVVDDNVLQQRTIRSRKKMYQELSSRLKLLTDDELKYLNRGTHQEQIQLIWLAICRRYTFIRDFAIEVIHEAVLTLKSTVTYDDYNGFYAAKMVTHPELGTVADSTRRKVRQVLFRMLTEIQILDTDRTIQVTMLSPDLKSLIQETTPDVIRWYPVYDPKTLKVRHS